MTDPGTSRRRHRLGRLLHRLGPGLITGAAFAYARAWSVVLTPPAWLRVLGWGTAPMGCAGPGMFLS